MLRGVMIFWPGWFFLFLRSDSVQGRTLVERFKCKGSWEFGCLERVRIWVGFIFCWRWGFIRRIISKVEGCRLRGFIWLSLCLRLESWFWVTYILDVSFVEGFSWFGVRLKFIEQQVRGWSCRPFTVRCCRFCDCVFRGFKMHLWNGRRRNGWWDRG